MLLTGIFSSNSNSRYSDFIKDENLPENAFILANGQKISVIMYRSPSCECCHLYLDYLGENGFQILEKSFEDYADIKEDFMIPANLRTCHTTIIENYYIEGHIPLSVVLVLLQEMPDIDGLALPGMPSGSPGMGGQ